MTSKFILFISGILIGIGVMYLTNLIDRPNQVFHDLPKPYYEVLYENEDVRVVEHIMRPNDEEPLHTHPKMYVYFLDDCNALVADIDGNSNERSFKRGDNFAVDGQTHSVINIGNTNLHSILIELNE
jgi:hypothetical protein